jgi:Ca2+-binding RTX toxin-like protein
MTYFTYDLPGLTPAAMSSAIALKFGPYNPSSGIESRFETYAIYATAENNATAHENFYWYGRAGATYEIVSSSFFDPFLLEIFDNAGKVIAIDDGTVGYGYDHAIFVAPYTGIYYANASWDQGSASLNKAVAIGVWQDVDTIKRLIVNGSEASDRINGALADENFYGFAGNDVVSGGGGSDYFDGGDGLDTMIYADKRSDVIVSKIGENRLTVTNKYIDEGVDTLLNVERVQLVDSALAFDLTGNAGQAFRLYQAAFDRAPDKSGLGYWISQMDHGATLTNVASFFIESTEFRQLYGASPTSSEFVNHLYANILHRVPDPAGAAYWANVLETHAATTANVLASFSESSENQAQVIGTIQNGIEFTPWQ